MATLPDPTDALTGAARARYEEMASARAHADGRPSLGEVYVRMFNNPGLAGAVGAVGEQIRFHGVLPDDVRELAILRCSWLQGLGYEWSHHQRPARLAGIDESVLAALAEGQVPDELAVSTKAVLAAVDATVAKRSIPSSVQDEVVAAFGLDGVVELVVLCGLYTLIGLMTTAFDIPIEAGFPAPPEHLGGDQTSG